MDEISTRRAAHEDLQYIRRTLAAAGHISTVPGWGLVAIGVLALLTVWVDQVSHLSIFAQVQAEPSTDFSQGLQGVEKLAWAIDRMSSLALWLALFAVCLTIGGWAMRAKARRTGQVFWSPVLRKALWGYSAALWLGGLLTGPVLAVGRGDLLPEIWLGCYGVALVSAGSYSVSPVRWMGLCFLLSAAGATLTAPSLEWAWLAVGFGWVHIAFGAYIAWRYDG